MQVANVFTIGGALSVNANGIDPQNGPLIESVVCLKIMLADGTIVTASRTENSQLFSLVIGGYGLFGIILEVSFQVVENNFYQRESCRVAINDYAQFLRTMAQDRAIGFHFGMVNLTISKEKIFSDITAVCYRKIDAIKFTKNKIRSLTAIRRDRAPLKYIRQLGLALLRKIPAFKALHAPLDESRDGDIRSRNFIMSPPVSQVYSKPKKETDLLQEYFIPLDGFTKFMEKLDTATRKYAINLMHIELRYIPKNSESFLSYARTDVIGIVIFFNQKISSQATYDVQQWTRALIECAYQLGGAYYLPIQLHATCEQLSAIYPTIDTFFVMKKQYDPNELFMNHFYEKYRDIN